MTGLVEKLDSGDMAKSPWTGRTSEPNCKQQMAIEARSYARLRVHPRVVRVKDWNPVHHILTLEYMPNSNLKEYVRKHGQKISVSQRRQWVKESAVGVDFLHSQNVIQSDLGPHNILIDSDHGLKFCDFAGSSLDGSQVTLASGVRYASPNVDLFGGDKKKKDLLL